MRLLWTLGWRNIWRNYRRTAITVSALAFTMALLVFFMGFMTSYTDQMLENVVGMTLGDLQVHHPRFLSDQNLYQVVEDAPKLLEAFRKRGFAAAPRCYGYGLVSAEAKGKSAGVRLKGIEPEAENRVTNLHLPKYILSGRYLSGKTRIVEQQAEPAVAAFVDPLDDQAEAGKGQEASEDLPTLQVGEIVLGRKLAESLRVQPGDTVTIVTMAADGSMGNELFDVVGIFRNFSDLDDRSLGLVSIRDFRRLFSFPESQVHEIALRASGGATLAGSKEIVQETIAAWHGSGGGESLLPEVLTWREIVPDQATMLDYSQTILLVLVLAMYMGAGLVILNSMLMMVFERIREFGVMKAVGFKPRQLLGLVYFETFWICVVAGIAGAAVGIPFTSLVGDRGLDLSSFAPQGFSFSGTVFDPVFHAVVTTEGVLVPLAAMFVISFVAVLYPAVKAAVIEPVKALYHV